MSSKKMSILVEKHVVLGGERCHFLLVEEDVVFGEVLRTYERVLRTPVLRTPVLRTDWLMLISPTGRFFQPGIGTRVLSCPVPSACPGLKLVH